MGFGVLRSPGVGATDRWCNQPLAAHAALWCRLVHNGVYLLGNYMYKFQTIGQYGTVAGVCWCPCVLLDSWVSWEAWQPGRHVHVWDHSTVDWGTASSLAACLSERLAPVSCVPADCNTVTCRCCCTCCTSYSAQMLS